MVNSELSYYYYLFTTDLHLHSLFTTSLMSNIRRQSIISSLVVYFGFALGLLNTYFFTRQGGFTKEQYGLTNTFIAFANIMFSVASLGMPAYISKFFPYYKAHLSNEKNDQLGWALLIPCIGFSFVFWRELFLKMC